MKKIMKRILILLGIFILALSGYFLLSMKKGKGNAVYTSIEDADLPVVSIKMFDREMNSLYGFIEGNRFSAGRDSLTVLPEDRQLEVSFHDVDSKVEGIQYEIRSLDGERLVERTALEKWNQETNEVSAVLPIQNLLTKEEEYLLTLTIATEKHPAIYYYTRVVWSDRDYVKNMVELAEGFSEKTLNYESAKELTTYLETDAAADNSSLGRVTLKNNFSQLTWRGMEAERVGDVSVKLKELQGIMGMVQLNYVVSRTAEDGKKEYYDISESFTMKWNAQRIYMMDYDRRMNQIFSGEDSRYSGKRIMLGISDGEELQTVSDHSGKYKAFVANRALWFYDTEKESSTKVFAFRKSEDDLRTNFDNHGVKILAVGENGEIDFLVYGYMNRGNHEGTTGVALYRYESEDNTLTERLYLPSSEDYWSLRQDVNRLSFLSNSEIFYLMMDHAVYGVDLASKEYMVVADKLTEENFAVSENGARIAWQEGSDIYSSKRLHVMDLQKGTKDEIYLSNQSILRLIGFVGSDLVYGISKPGDKYQANGRDIGLALHSLEIVGEDMKVETRYEKQGIYLTDVQIRDSRVHLMRMVKTDAVYVKTEEDTLVCNETVVPDPLDGMGYIAADKPGRLYFVQLDTEEKKDQTIRLHVPKKVVAEEDNIRILKPNEGRDGRVYYAYSGGRMNASFTSFSKAVEAAFEGMGIVTDQYGNVVWSRAGRSDIKNIKDVQNKVPQIRKYLEELSKGHDTSSDGTKIIDARGCTLNQILYFIYRGNPVEAYLKDGSRVLIYGYDQYNVSCLWNAGTEEEHSEKMGLNDAAAYFALNSENDFICFLETK